MKKLIALLLVLIMSAALIAACDSGTPTETATPTPAANTPDETAPPKAEPPKDDTVYKLDVSFGAPEFSLSETVAAFDRIQEASNGRIEFTYYFSWSLTSVATCIDDINAGIVDICMVPPTEHLNLFPYTNLVTYTPFLGLPSLLDAAEIYDELYAQYPEFEQEYAKNGLVYWTNFPAPTYNIYTTKNHEIRVPEDMNGLKIITSSPLLQKLVSKSGGAPVATPVTEYATSLSTNVVDGLINHANIIFGFGCSDFVHAATVFGETGMTTSLQMFVFDQDVWNELPEDLKALFDAEAEALRDNQGALDATANTQSFEMIQGRDQGVTYLTVDEIQVWKDMFESIRDEYLDELVASGSDKAQEIYEAVGAKIAERS